MKQLRSLVVGVPPQPKESGPFLLPPSMPLSILYNGILLVLAHTVTLLRSAIWLAVKVGICPRALLRALMTRASPFSDINPQRFGPFVTERTALTAHHNSPPPPNTTNHSTDRVDRVDL